MVECVVCLEIGAPSGLIFAPPRVLSLCFPRSTLDPESNRGRRSSGVQTVCSSSELQHLGRCRIVAVFMWPFIGV
jgi:hypothetical protein